MAKIAKICSNKPKSAKVPILQAIYLDVACIFLQNSKYQMEQYMWDYILGDLHFLSKNI
jgi:hypothetical protein